jgi:hypothetical protein
MNEWTMTHIDEPMLSFGFNQQTEHPKDGLFLYGPPASNQNPARMDVGVTFGPCASTGERFTAAVSAKAAALT